jgi:hypothetical protein
MDIKHQIADLIAEFDSEDCTITDPNCMNQKCFECVTTHIITDVLCLSDAQLLELQKEGAKLVVQCADQTLPENNYSLETVNDFTQRMAVQVYKESQLTMLEAGFVKAVGG